MQLNRYASDYDLDATKISFSYLLEVTAALREYYNSLVLIGGWAPFFILEHFKRPAIDFKHIGSIDIDLAVDPVLFDEGIDKYRTIIEHIEKLGYKQKKDRLNNIVPSSFVKSTREGVDIQVDFLTSFFEKHPKSKRHLKIQPDLMARRTKGCEAAFTHNWECPLTGNLPGDGEIKLKIKVADAVSGIVMKGQALGERLDGKDPYDIYAMVAYYKDGPFSVAEEFKPFVKTPIIASSLKIIDENFEKQTSNGPVRAGYFLYPNDPSMREKAVTDAYMTVREFLKIVQSKG
ncbi:MAG: hypothetical protein HY606_09195 [Planctomycetes bacterium]|nr:hypothetical protein [Planctomycetota bacterium]